MGQVLDIEALANSLGAQVSEVRDDGSVVLSSQDEAGETVTRVLDVPALAQAEGIDLAKTDIRYNTSDTAIDQDAIGFGLGVKLSLTNKVEDRLRLLQGEFGQDNVRTSGSDIVVKDKGVWKKAEASCRNIPWGSIRRGRWFYYS